MTVSRSRQGVVDGVGEAAKQVAKAISREDEIIINTGMMICIHSGGRF